MRHIEEKLAENNLYFSSDKAAIGFGKEANPATQETNREQYSAIYSIGIGQNRLYFNGELLSGGHNNVIIELAGTLSIGKPVEMLTLGLVQYEGFSHTHPYCTGHEAKSFSGIIGDQGAAIMAGKAYLVTPSGEVKYITSEDAIGAIIAGENINSTITREDAVVPKYAQIVGEIDGYSEGVDKFDCTILSDADCFWGNTK